MSSQSVFTSEPKIKDIRVRPSIMKRLSILKATCDKSTIDETIEMLLDKFEVVN